MACSRGLWKACKIRRTNVDGFMNGWKGPRSAKGDGYRCFWACLIEVEDLSNDGLKKTAPSQGGRVLGEAAPGGAGNTLELFLQRVGSPFKHRRLMVCSLIR